MCIYRAFSQIIPLLYFCKSAVGFKNPKPITIVTEIITILDILACILQLCGIIAFSQSMYVFHVILPVTLCFLTAYIIYEFVHNQNNRAKRIMIPVGILAAASCAEIINYLTKIVPSDRDYYFYCDNGKYHGTEYKRYG